MPRKEPNGAHSPTEQPEPTTSLWGIGVQHVVYVALSAALYGGLSYLTNIIQLPSAGNVSLRPAIVIPLLFSVLYVPWVGLFSGVLATCSVTGSPAMVSTGTGILAMASLALLLV